MWVCSMTYDQCENAEVFLNPEELISPKSTLSGNIPIKRDLTLVFTNAKS